ncbi:hypothetical protein V7S43_012554 [Phytophthora oleae]|uniref:Uncharacterized protein n=1 Tax=Phytophthora oleae TaxID=2107226 RepID=A0ABD3F5V6_9STRA
MTLTAAVSYQQRRSPERLRMITPWQPRTPRSSQRGVAEASDPRHSLHIRRSWPNATLRPSGALLYTGSSIHRHISERISHLVVLPDMVAPRAYVDPAGPPADLPVKRSKVFRLWGCSGDVLMDDQLAVPDNM